MDIDAQAACDSIATPGEWQCGVRRLAVANGPNIFQMLLVDISGCFGLLCRHLYHMYVLQSLLQRLFEFGLLEVVKIRRQIRRIRFQSVVNWGEG